MGLVRHPQRERLLCHIGLQPSEAFLMAQNCKKRKRDFQVLLVVEACDLLMRVHQKVAHLGGHATHTIHAPGNF
jgi:hypothetical protein